MKAHRYRWESRLYTAGLQDHLHTYDLLAKGLAQPTPDRVLLSSPLALGGGRPGELGQTLAYLAGLLERPRPHLGRVAGPEAPSRPGGPRSGQHQRLLVAGRLERGRFLYLYCYFLVPCLERKNVACSRRLGAGGHSYSTCLANLQESLGIYSHPALGGTDPKIQAQLGLASAGERYLLRCLLPFPLNRA